MSQFATRFALICNKTKLPQFITSLPHFVIHIYVCYWVLLLLLQPLWFSVRESNLPSHMTHWSCDHMILKKNFISTFASTIPTNFSKEWLKSSERQPSSHVTHLSCDHFILAKMFISSFTTTMIIKLGRVMSKGEEAQPTLSSNLSIKWSRAFWETSCIP